MENMIEIIKFIARIFIAEVIWATAIIALFALLNYALDSFAISSIFSKLNSDALGIGVDTLFLVIIVSIAIVLTVIASVVQLAFIYKKGSGLKLQYLNRIQTQTFKSNLDYVELFEVCKDAILLVPAKIIDSGKNEGRIDARTGTNNSGLGEKINITIKKNGIVEISSRSLNPLKVLDLGRNVDNTQLIAKYIKRQSG